MAVNLIDPNDVISQLPETVNGMPDYSSMYIFAELVAYRKARSVLISNGGSTQVETNFSNTTINMMGFDQDQLRHTTRWTETINNSVQTPYEGFGITNIKIDVNSSYVPVVNIDFIDIKGLALFNLGENSPYSVLHDFPPPLYKLTVKGYYGKALQYDLHLKKQFTRFDSETGNYYTSAEFVGRTFAPLSDVIFKYVEIFPFIFDETANPIDRSIEFNSSNPQEQSGSASSDETKVPENTFDLLLKAKALYDRIKDFQENSQENEKIENFKTQTDKIDSIFNLMNNFSERLDSAISGQDNTSVIIYNENDDDTNESIELLLVPRVKSYDERIRKIKSEGVLSTDFTSSLHLGVKSELNSEDNLNIPIPTGKEGLIRSNLTEIKNALVNEANLFSTITSDDISIETISKSTTRTNNVTIEEKYITLNVTSFYQKLFKEKSKLSNGLSQAEEELRNKTNAIAKKTLGLVPTIYNIFKVMCDDVDLFFNILRSVAVKAQEHHDRYSDQILGNTNFPESKIYPFPLYIKATSEYGSTAYDVTQTNPSTSFTREERAYPSDISQKLDEPFPEVELVEDFLAAYIQVERERAISDLKSAEDDAGNKKWIPISPADSEPVSSEFALQYPSPYANLVKNPNNIYSVLLRRFYILSQFSYGSKFYENTDRVRQVRRFTAKAEAVNVANTIVDQQIINTLLTNIKQFRTNVDSFYNQIQNELNLSSFNNITPNQYITLEDGRRLYNNRTYDEYNGFIILDNLPATRVAGVDNSTQDIVDSFLDSNESRNIFQTIADFFSSDNEIEFTTENLFFFNDTPQGNTFQTNYIYFFAAGFNNNENRSFAKTWSRILGGEEISTGILGNLNDNSYREDVLGFIIASNFGFSVELTRQLVPTEIFKNFDLPGVVSVPNFSIWYTGGLVRYNNDAQFKQQVDEILSQDFIQENVTGNILFISNTFANKLLPTNPLTLVQNAAESIKVLSNPDKELLENEFDNYITTQFSINLKNFIIRMINNVETEISQPNTTFENREQIYLSFLSDGGNYSITISEALNNHVAIYNFSDITFNDVANAGTTPNVFEPLSITNADQNKKTINDTFFINFFSELETQLNSRSTEIKNIDKRLRTVLEDDDIKNQCYYSFKSINDRWLTGNGGDITKGYPLNEKGKSFISNFKFVDRAFNNIGNDSVINIEPLANTVANNFDRSIISVFSTILSLNNYEFFPLQNFMSFKEEEWENSFKTFQNLSQTAEPAFICMYIGGTSSFLNSKNSEFENDGIIDLKDDIIPDFKTQSDDGFFSNIRAFRVRFAEQNQSVFNNIEFDTREHEDTNESLAILSKIAQDNSTSAPVPKGQNLFNTYETRSYSSKVGMLGNMMIQPTQYFQIENVPMFSGAYMILRVSHEFIPNHSTTSFEGVRVVKFPVPLVRDFATAIGFPTSVTSDASTAGGFSGTQGGATANGNIDNRVIIFDNMNDLKINL